MNFFQKNIRFILISFSIIAFVVFYLLAVKLFNSNKNFYVFLDKSLGFNEGDLVYAEDEKIGRIHKLDTLKYISHQMLARLVLNRNLNIPDKSYLQIENPNGSQLKQLELILIASNGYFEKNDTIPLKIADTSFGAAQESTQEPEKKEVEEVKQPVVADTLKPVMITEKKENKIVFKVQFMVSADPIPTDSKKFRGIRDVGYYKDKSMYKFVSGNTQILSESIKYCEEIKKLGFPDAFVVAFNGDERIPVKEAVQLLKK